MGWFYDVAIIAAVWFLWDIADSLGDIADSFSDLNDHLETE